MGLFRAIFLGFFIFSIMGCDTPEDRSQFSIHMKAVLLIDNDGGRAPIVTPSEIQTWVESANQIFESSKVGIQIEFNPKKDIDLVYDSMLNNISNTALDYMGTPYCSTIDDCEKYRNKVKLRGERVAALYPGYLTTIFRHGLMLDAKGKFDPNGRAGNAFAGSALNYVVMPSVFDERAVLVHKNAENERAEFSPYYSMLAHEIGHFLNLPHTFPKWVDDLKTQGTLPEQMALLNQLAAKYASVSPEITSGDLTSIFDGDGLSDTAPDAGLIPYSVNNYGRCDGPDTYTIAKSIRLTPDRTNTMSYFMCGQMRFTPQQKSTMIDCLNDSSCRRTMVELAEQNSTVTTASTGADKPSAYSLWLEKSSQNPNPTEPVIVGPAVCTGG